MPGPRRVPRKLQPRNRIPSITAFLPRGLVTVKRQSIHSLQMQRIPIYDTYTHLMDFLSRGECERRVKGRKQNKTKKNWGGWHIRVRGIEPRLTAERCTTHYTRIISLNLTHTRYIQLWRAQGLVSVRELGRSATYFKCNSSALSAYHRQQIFSRHDGRGQFECTRPRKMVCVSRFWMTIAGGLTAMTSGGCGRCGWSGALQIAG